VDCMNPECLASGPPSANGSAGAIAAWNRSGRAAP
jgi:hypothetical protein